MGRGGRKGWRSRSNGRACGPLGEGPGLRAVASSHRPPPPLPLTTATSAALGARDGPLGRRGRARLGEGLWWPGPAAEGAASALCSPHAVQTYSSYLITGSHRDNGCFCVTELHRFQFASRCYGEK
ncbi:uncharacterized protein ACIBXB_018126 isoform 2-T3 [Morphnus guianensis]